MADTTAVQEGKKTYMGNCHCGAFKFEVTIPEFKMIRGGKEGTQAADCDCSICAKKGCTWFFPGDGNLTILRGTVDETLKSYEFNSNNVSHKFCPKCGTAVMAIKKEAPPGMKIAINARTLQAIDLDALALAKYPGKTLLSPQYNPPQFPDHGLSITREEESEGLKIYTGSCHCGDVKVAVKSKPLESGEVEIKEDDCSYCRRHALTFIYPTPISLTSLSTASPESLTSYTYGRGFAQQRFCSTCGIMVHTHLLGPPAAALEGASEARKEFIRKRLDMRPVNVRVLDEWAVKGKEGWGVEGLVKRERGELEKEPVYVVD